MYGWRNPESGTTILPQGGPFLKLKFLIFMHDDVGDDMQNL